jgi:tetratricopeptide (TPR) repeat protein
MKNKFLVLFTVIFMMMFLVVGCKSDPEVPPTETPVEEVPPVEPTPKPEPVVEPTPEPTPVVPEVLEEELLANATKAFDNATSMKDKIEKLSFASYNESSYNDGISAFEKYNSLVAENGSATEKLTNAILAEKKYKEVLDSAFFKLAAEKKVEVVQVRNDALEIKSDKADKVGFEAAQLLFVTAETASAAKEFEKAYDYYAKAKDAFSDVYSNVSSKRAAALEAIERAKNKAADVESFAEEADEIAPITSQTTTEEE